ATESFQLQLLKEDESGDEALTVEKLTSDASPIIRLVDSTIFTAIQRRASDIHIETQDDAVHVKYRIDGVLQPAMRPIAKQFHSSIISRIKVMAELDIAEKRVPQDGRFKLRMPGKTIDFRVSIMPSVHGEDSVIRILDKESISEQFTELRLDILGFPEAELKRLRKYIAEPYGMVLVTGPTGSGKTTTLYAVLSEINSVEDKKVTRARLEESGLDLALEFTHTFYEGVGCIECGGTGYKRRTAICVLLDLTDRSREMILEKRPTSEIKKAAREEGMRFLRESAVERVMDGVTTLREINKVTFVE